MNPLKAVKMFVLAIVFLILMLGIMGMFGLLVQVLWNWLMPAIFGLKVITYWQAVGLLGLSWLLFGGFGWFGGARRRYGSRAGSGMSEEQKARMREVMWRRFCGEPPPAAPGAAAPGSTP